MTAPIMSPGINIKNIIPKEIYNNSENFVLFLKAYYEWMRTCSFTVSIISGIGFTKDETVVGLTSGGTAKVKQIKSGEIVVLVSTNSKPFNRGENIRGQTSNTVASLRGITDNVIRQTENLIDYRDVTKSVDKFSDSLKDELYSGLSSELTNGVNTRLVGRKLRDFYEAKGQEDSYKFIMKLLYDQDIEISYPGDEILIVSDGKYVKDRVLRTISIASDGDANIFDFLFKTVRGVDSNAIGKVVDIKKFYIQNIEVTEMRLSLVSGTFQGGEKIFDVDNPLGALGLYTTTYGMVSGYNIVDGGSGYVAGEFLNIVGDGISALIKVTETFTSGIDSIIVPSIGHGYQLGTIATVDNTGTGGTGLSIKVTGISNTYTVTAGSNTYTVGQVSNVSVITRGEGYSGVPGITLRDTTIYNLGLLTDKFITITNAGSNYRVGDWLSFSSAYGSLANAEIASVVEADANTDYNIYLENGAKLIQETTQDYIKYDRSNTSISVWSGQGPIARIRMTNFGSGYSANSLPSVTINTSTGSSGVLTVTGLQGQGANVSVDVANNYGGIGAIRELLLVDFGVSYTQANTTIDATGAGNGNANIAPVISGLGVTKGDWTNDDGKVDYKKIQDSYYYQEYSYVIKSGVEISRYRDVLKKLIHPVGLEVFGEISIVNLIDASMPSSITSNLDFISSIVITILAELAYSPISKVSDQTGNITTIGNLTIDVIDDALILDYEFETFNSVFAEIVYQQYERNTLQSGTVTVYAANSTIIGSGTTFLASFANGAKIVVDGNKFEITGSIINGTLTNTLMTINVPPETNLVNKPYYRVSPINV